MASDLEHEVVRLTTLEAKARRKRSVGIAIALAGLVVLFYVVTLFKMGAVG